MKRLVELSGCWKVSGSFSPTIAKALDLYMYV